MLKELAGREKSISAAGGLALGDPPPEHPRIPRRVLSRDREGKGSPLPASGSPLKSGTWLRVYSDGAEPWRDLPYLDPEPRGPPWGPQNPAQSPRPGGSWFPRGVWMPRAPWQASPTRNRVKYSSAPHLQPGTSPGLEKIQAPSGRGRMRPPAKLGGWLLPPFWHFRRLRDAVSLLLGPASSRMAQEILQPGRCC